MQNKTNPELVALLDNEEMRDAAATQLLQQSPSQDDLCQIIRRELHNMKPAWELYQSRATKEELYGDIHWIHVRDWLEEPLLKFDLNQEELYRFLRYGGGREATWQRLLMTSPDKDLLLGLLSDSGYANEIAAYLLAQADDNELLSYIVRYTDHHKEAWERLKNNNPDKDCLRTVMDTEYAIEAWELYLRFPVEKFDLYVLMNYNERLKDVVAAELLNREPTQNDLIGVVGNSSLWQPAWEELLKRGIDNFELANLISGTGFKELAWEQLKKQSPTMHQLRSAINDEDYESEYNAIVGAYMLECSPGNEDLRYLIDYVEEVREPAINMLLQQGPDERDLELIARYRFSESEIAKADIADIHSEEQLIEIFNHDYERRKEAWLRLQQLNPLSPARLKALYKDGYSVKHLIWEEVCKHPLTTDDLVFYYCYADDDFRPEIWARLTEGGFENAHLEEIIEFGHVRPASDLLLEQSPTYEQLRLIIRKNYDDDILSATLLKALELDLDDEDLDEIIFASDRSAKIAGEELFKRGTVTDDQLFFFIRDTTISDKAWAFARSRPANHQLLERLLKSSYRLLDEIWEFTDKDLLSQETLINLITDDRLQQECAAVLRQRFGMDAEDEGALKRRIALKVIDEGGELLIKTHHLQDAHSLAGWAVVLSEQGKKIETERGTLAAACALIPTLGEYLVSSDLERVREALVGEKYVKP